ncbi:MAG: hypothetical protein AABY07_09330 [Nanoarchaeota archaeon]|mgnify:CR=1 FL=1
MPQSTLEELIAKLPASIQLKIFSEIENVPLVYQCDYCDEKIDVFGKVPNGWASFRGHKKADNRTGTTIEGIPVYELDLQVILCPLHLKWMHDMTNSQLEN